jgi:hypothetical protein
MKTSDLPEHCIINIGLNSPMEVQRELHYLGCTWASGASLLTLTYPSITCYRKEGNYIFYGTDLQEVRNKFPDYIVISLENFSNTKRLYDD